MADSDDAANSDNKRKRTESNSSADAGIPAWIAASSPPRFVSLEELMNTADSLDKMALAHEIAVNSDFKFEPTMLPEGSLARRVHDMVHQAFWDVLREELSHTPPEYEHALVLLQEVKDTLLSLLLPHHTKLRSEIDERLDMQLIRQQCEQQCIDFQPIALYILNVMKKLCAPLRDAGIDALMHCTDIVDLYKGIFETLDLMKLDMANFTIATMRPAIQQHSIEYERERFAKYLETNPNGLEATERWLRRAYNEIIRHRENIEQRSEDTKRHAATASSIPETPDSEEAPTFLHSPSSSTPNSNTILTLAYWSLLDISSDEIMHEDYPETLIVDRDRIVQMRRSCRQLIGTAAAVVLTCSSAGRNISDLRDFKDMLKGKLDAVLADCDTSEQLVDRLAGVAELVSAEIDQVLQQLELPEWDASRKETLKKQIVQLADGDQPVRKLIGDRLKAFVLNVISTPSASPIKIPPGLSVVQKELARLTGAFLHVVSHNRQVFSPYYDTLIEKILASSS